MQGQAVKSSKSTHMPHYASEVSGRAREVCPPWSYPTGKSLRNFTFQVTLLSFLKWQMARQIGYPSTRVAKESGVTVRQLFLRKLSKSFKVLPSSYHGQLNRLRHALCPRPYSMETRFSLRIHVNWVTHCVDTVFVNCRNCKIVWKGENSALYNFNATGKGCGYMNNII